LLTQNQAVAYASAWPISIYLFYQINILSPMMLVFSHQKKKPPFQELFRVSFYRQTNGPSTNYFVTSIWAPATVGMFSFRSLEKYVPTMAPTPSIKANATTNIHPRIMVNRFLFGALADTVFLTAVFL